MRVRVEVGCAGELKLIIIVPAVYNDCTTSRENPASHHQWAIIVRELQRHEIIVTQ